MQSGKSGGKLIEIIEHAIHDLEVTPSEYNAIMAAAADDSHIDSQERALLKEFQAMIANGTIKRVRGK
jgi:hypothetical protein